MDVVGPVAAGVQRLGQGEEWLWVVGEVVDVENSFWVRDVVLLQVGVKTRSWSSTIVQTFGRAHYGMFQRWFRLRAAYSQCVSHEGFNTPESVGLCETGPSPRHVVNPVYCESHLELNEGPSFKV